MKRERWSKEGREGGKRQGERERGGDTETDRETEGTEKRRFWRKRKRETEGSRRVKRDIYRCI